LAVVAAHQINLTLRESVQLQVARVELVTFLLVVLELHLLITPLVAVEAVLVFMERALTLQELTGEMVEMAAAVAVAHVFQEHRALAVTA
jgi:hypothetical protein